MPHIRRDWYQHDPPAARGGAPVARVAVRGTPPLGQRLRTALRRPGSPHPEAARQTMGAIVAGSVLGLALLGMLVYGTVAGDGSGAVAGQQARRGVAVGAQPPEGTQATPAPEGTRPTTGDPTLDRVLREAEQEGRLTPEQIAAISREISGQPTFDNVRRLTEADIQRIADATGLPPEQLAPVLARLVATGRIVMPARLPQAVAGAQTPPPAASGESADPTGRTGQAVEAVAGATASRDQAYGPPPDSAKDGGRPAGTPVGPPWK